MKMKTWTSGYVSITFLLSPHQNKTKRKGTRKELKNGDTRITNQTPSTNSPSPPLPPNLLNVAQPYMYLPTKPRGHDLT